MDKNISKMSETKSTVKGKMIEETPENSKVGSTIITGDIKIGMIDAESTVKGKMVGEASGSTTHGRSKTSGEIMYWVLRTVIRTRTERCIIIGEKPGISIKMCDCFSRGILRPRHYNYEFKHLHLNISFRGRDQEIAKLESLFFKENNQTIVISGFPGFGKSELAKQFAHNCLSKGLIRRTYLVTNHESVRYLADLLLDICRRCKEDRCLFIIDNEDLPVLDYYYYLQSLGYNNYLLKTSYRKNLRDPFRYIEILELNPLSTESAIEIFKSILGSNYKEEDRAFYIELANVVENVPLGLKIMAEKIKDLGSNMSDIQKYDDIVKQYYRRTSYVTMKSSLDKMKSIDEAVNSDFLLNLLYICSYLNQEFIYLEDLFLIPNMVYMKNTTTYKEPFEVLVDFLFVNYKSKEKKFIEIYRLTQNFLRYNLKENEQYNLQNKVYTSCLQYIFEEVNDLKYNMHHIKAILDYAEENVTTVSEFYYNHVQNMKIIENIFENLAKYGCIKCLVDIIKKCDSATKPIVLSNRNLYIAAKYDHIEILKLFFDYIDINETNAQNETILHVLVRTWDIKQLALLFKLKPKLTIKNNVGNVPLFEFVNRPNLPRNIYWNFVLNKFQFNAIDINDNKETLLHIAAANYHDVLVKVLITEHNMNVNDKDAQGRTPLDVLKNTFSSPTFHNIEINRGLATAKLLAGLQNAK